MIFNTLKQKKYIIFLQCNFRSLNFKKIICKNFNVNLKENIQHKSCEFKFYSESSVQFSSVTQSCLTLCDLMNSSTPGLPVHHQFPEFTQIHGHRVSDAIQPSHPLLSPSPPAPNPSQHQSFFPMSQLFA